MKKQKSILTVLAVMLSISLITVFLAAFRGIDSTDEGLYLLKMRHDIHNYISGSYYFYLISWIPDTFGISIIGLRLLRLILLLASVLFFTHALVKYYNSFSAQINKAYLILFGTTAGFMSYFFGPQTVSYNHINAFLITVIFGFFLLFKAGTKTKILSASFVFMIGILSVFLIFTKITSGMLILLFIAALTLFDKKVNKKLFIISLSAGLLTGGYIFHLLSGDVFAVTAKMLHAGSMTITHAESYSSFRLLENFFKFLKRVFVDLIYSAATVYAVIFALKMKGRFEKNGINYGVAAVLLIAASWNIIYLISNLKLGILHTHLYLIFVLLLSMYYFKKHFFGMQNEEKTVFILLFTVPVLSAAGTNNTLFYNILFLSFFWSMLVFLLAQKIRYGYKAVSGPIIVFLTLFITVGLYNSLWLRPYRTLPLDEQVHKFGIENAFNLKVDKETAEFYTGLKRSLFENGYKKDYPVAVFFKDPLINYLLQAPAPGGISWSEERMDSYFYNLKHIRPLTEKNEKRPVIIINADISRQFRDSLSKYFDFPGSYTMKDKLSRGKKQYKVWMP